MSLVFAKIIKLAEFVQQIQQAFALVTVQIQLAGHSPLGLGESAADVDSDYAARPGDFADSPEQFVEVHRALIPICAELGRAQDVQVDGEKDREGFPIGHLGVAPERSHPVTA